MPLCSNCDAIDEYEVIGNTDTFTFSFEYVLPDDINIAVRDRFTREFEDIPRSAWTFENLNTIKITPPPQADVAIYRCTNVSAPAAVFYPGNSIKAEDLNANQTQVLNAIKELRCALEDCCNGNGGGDDGGCNNNNDCPEGEVCYDGQCAQTCSIDADCPEGYVCYNGICILECDVDADCPEGQECRDGVCLISCDDTSDCPDGYVCRDGVCLAPCDENGNCDEGFACVNGLCEPTSLEDAPSDGRLYGRQDADWKLAIPYDFTLLPELVPPNETQPDPNDPVGETNVDLEDAPSDGELYGRIDATWSTALLYNLSELPPIPSEEDEGEGETGETEVSVQAIEEAPADGSMYGRKDATWSPALQHNLSTLNQLPEGTT